MEKEKEQPRLSHTDDHGKANMVDVGDKPISRREARAEGFISLNDTACRLIRENGMKKGDVLTVAEIAGITAAKRCSDLIPLCHPLLLTKVEVHARLEAECVAVESRICCTGQTGVEMEALTAVSVALLTVYDMCKAVDKAMIIRDVRLIEKSKTTI